MPQKSHTGDAECQGVMDEAYIIQFHSKAINSQVVVPLLPGVSTILHNMNQFEQGAAYKDMSCSTHSKRTGVFDLGLGAARITKNIYNNNIDTSNDSKHDLWEHGLRRRRRSLRVSGAVTCLDVQEQTMSSLSE